MLKSVKNLAILLSLTLLPGLALAQGKIAVVSLERAILSTDKAQAQIEELRKEKDYAANEKELEQLKKEGQSLIDKLQTDGAVMSQEQKEELSQKIATKRDDIKHVIKKLQDSARGLQQKILREQEELARNVVNEMIKTEGIGLLINEQAAMFADSSYDITAKVTDKLNQAAK